MSFYLGSESALRHMDHRHPTKVGIVDTVEPVLPDENLKILDVVLPQKTTYRSNMELTPPRCRASPETPVCSGGRAVACWAEGDGITGCCSST